jgi:hypothetical protein
LGLANILFGMDLIVDEEARVGFFVKAWLPITVAAATSLMRKLRRLFWLTIFDFSFQKYFSENISWARN